MKKTYFVAALLLFILFSCHKGKVFEGHTKLDNYIWNKSNEVEFNFHVDDTLSTYLISVDLRHATFYVQDYLSIQMTMIAPGGSTASIDLSIPVKDEHGKFIGNGLGDIWDLSSPVLERFKFPDVGNYTFSIRHDMEEENLMAVMEIGLLIEKEKPKS